MLIKIFLLDYLPMLKSADKVVARDFWNECEIIYTDYLEKKINDKWGVLFCIIAPVKRLNQTKASPIGNEKIIFYQDITHGCTLAQF